MKIQEAIDTIFSHNEIVGIWKDFISDGIHFSELEWSGMAHEIPKQFLNENNWKIFGVVAEKLCESDRINIKIL